mgnify:FL=1
MTTIDKQTIRQLVQESFAETKTNNFGAIGHPEEKIWAKIDCGFAAGDDPLYPYYKKEIGDFFWTPAEAYKKFYPDAQVEDKDLTVLSIVFASDDHTRELQRKQKKAPNFRWLYARNCFETIEGELCDHIIERLAKAGIRAVAPDMSPQWGWRQSEKFGLSCNWSHRHSAYIAGLGTWGLCDGMITRLGKAVRFTTLVLETKLPADPRPYKDYHYWCLFYRTGKCDSCIKACPAGAISKDGHNKDLCEAYINDFKHSYIDSNALNANGPFGCGLCQGNVPCQKGVPKGLDDYDGQDSSGNAAN